DLRRLPSSTLFPYTTLCRSNELAPLGTLTSITATSPPAAGSWSSPGDYLPSQRPVGLGTSRLRRPPGDRFPGDRGLREPHRPVDHAVEHDVTERFHHPCHDLSGVQRPRIEHRRQYPADLELRVEPFPNLLN